MMKTLYGARKYHEKALTRPSSLQMLPRFHHSPISAPIASAGSVNLVLKVLIVIVCCFPSSYELRQHILIKNRLKLWISDQGLHLAVSLMHFQVVCMGEHHLHIILKE
ncbi:hypothetical protein RND71_021793 [Anisodus tanguticus]|uniref:Uncharacterized protein n=1 Tax=Anisodus tanguticus TaxID=243964 RepID=A0AAE1RVT4_9SOLA|nr:hypothetical protein RND71_021793 [Anisodus tanguticus]